MLGRADAVVRNRGLNRESVEQALREGLLEGLSGASPATELSRWMQDGAGLGDDEALRLAFG